LFENSKSLYITGEEGDMSRVEIYEHHGMIIVNIGDNFSTSMTPEDAFDLVDALTMIANDVDSHTGEE